MEEWYLGGLIIRRSEFNSRLRNMEDKLDAVFSLFIRLTYSDHAGYASCYTCAKRLHWTQLQCGHYLSRGNHAVRWDKDNARPQCKDCNEFNSGRQDVFRENLIDDLGEEEVLELEERAKGRTPTLEEQKALFSEYSEAVDRLGKSH